MGLDDLVNKAKDALHGHEDQAKDALDKAGDAVKSHTGDDTDRKVDEVVDKAKDYIDKGEA
ncbi:antitoxin [Cellulomonas sp. HZM]|uniref:antitoxin n=1 Tax=Cellulomonas sp. HZM TaxID=1454010 RepID=UPI000493889D|nr:antitoxin [Cellulomonas sp. HZM]